MEQLNTSQEEEGNKSCGQQSECMEEVSYQSDYENFMDSQIVHLIKQERQRNSDLSRADELLIAIDFCKKYLIDERFSPSRDNKRRSEEVLAKLVELNLELEQLKDYRAIQKESEPIKKVRGHEFVIQSANGRNPYCEVCLSTIWRLLVPWRRCKICGFRAHEKCVKEVRRPCVSLRISRQQQPLTFTICPEISLPAQNYECAECFAPIGFDEGTDREARLCDYNGKYYCKKCHWMDLMVIPARLVKNWDIEKRFVCRASKQLLAVMERKPIIDLSKENPALFKYVNSLEKMRRLRSSIMLMKCYFVCCRKAKKLRILQHLNHYQHFVETDSMYTMDDLIQLANGKLLRDIEQIVDIFRAHITNECEICKGNAFICELCDMKEPIYPFSRGVSICRECCAVFHQTCFDRVSKRCSRCARRKARKSSIVVFDEEEEKQ